MLLGKLNICTHTKIKLESSPHHTQKLTKVSQNIGANIRDVKLGKAFLDMITKKATGEK